MYQVVANFLIFVESEPAGARTLPVCRLNFVNLKK